MTPYKTTEYKTTENMSKAAKNRWANVSEEIRKEASKKMHTKRWLNKTKKERLAHIRMMIEAKNKLK